MRAPGCCWDAGVNLCTVALGEVAAALAACFFCRIVVPYRIRSRFWVICMAGRSKYLQPWQCPLQNEDDFDRGKVWQGGDQGEGEEWKGRACCRLMCFPREPGTC